MFDFARRANRISKFSVSENEVDLSNLIPDIRTLSFDPILEEEIEVSRKPLYKMDDESRKVAALPINQTPFERRVSFDSPDFVIMDARQIPKGSYISFNELEIPLSFNEHFILMSTSPHQYMLLVDVNVWGKAIHMEISTRLSAKLKLSDDGVKFISKKISHEVVISAHKSNEVTTLMHLKSDSNIEILAWKLINQAVAENASDLHIETRGSFAQIFFRIHGERVEQPTIAADTAAAMCNVLYTFHADSSSKRVSWSPAEVLDTAIEHQTPDGIAIQIRFSSGPIHPSPNFHSVCRLLVMDVDRTPVLDDIGYTPDQVSTVEDMLIGSQGMVLLVGPTNSGKSTSMQAFARHLVQQRGAGIKMITVEDPVEYIIPGACQMGVAHGRKQLEDKTGSVFNTILRGTLRQDPDVVIVGEIRDNESSGAVKDLVLAGRKLLTTLHVYEAMAVYSRLRELGIPESILYMNNFIAGIIYQRLVPTLCGKCSIPLIDGQQRGLADYKIFERVSRVVDLMNTNVRMRNPGGCAHCNERGITGRTVCSEMIIPDEIFLGHMRRGDLASARIHWQTNVDLNVNGMGVSAVAHALSKMVKGIVDPHDVESQIGRIKVDYVELAGTVASQNDTSRSSVYDLAHTTNDLNHNEQRVGNRMSSLYSVI